jgi:hypothetical protein
MKHLKLTFVGLLALTSAASDAFAFGPPGPPMGGPPMGGGLPMGGWPAASPDGRPVGSLRRAACRVPQWMAACRLPQWAAAPREMSLGISRHPALWEMSREALREMSRQALQAMSRQALREMSPALGITLAATPSITMVAETMATDTDTMATDTMAADATVTDAHMPPAPLPEPRLELQPPRATGRQRPIIITPRRITTIPVGTLITGATTTRLLHAPSDDALEDLRLRHGFFDSAFVTWTFDCSCASNSVVSIRARRRRHEPRLPRRNADHSLTTSRVRTATLLSSRSSPPNLVL